MKTQFLKMFFLFFFFWFWQEIAFSQQNYLYLSARGQIKAVPKEDFLTPLAEGFPLSSLCLDNDAYNAHYVHVRPEELDDILDILRDQKLVLKNQKQAAKLLKTAKLLQLKEMSQQISEYLESAPTLAEVKAIKEVEKLFSRDVDLVLESYLKELEAEALKLDPKLFNEMKDKEPSYYYGMILAKAFFKNYQKNREGEVEKSQLIKVEMLVQYLLQRRLIPSLMKPLKLQSALIAPHVFAEKVDKVQDPIYLTDIINSFASDELKNWLTNFIQKTKIPSSAEEKEGRDFTFLHKVENTFKEIFSPDNSLRAILFYNGKVEVYKVKTGKFVKELKISMGFYSQSTHPTFLFFAHDHHRIGLQYGYSDISGASSSYEYFDTEE